jgi:hypothetical protein
VGAAPSGAATVWSNGLTCIVGVVYAGVRITRQMHGGY